MIQGQNPSVSEFFTKKMWFRFFFQSVHHIKENDDKFGIILDGSTDSSGNHFLAVLFQILEQVRLITFLHILTNILKQI